MSFTHTFLKEEFNIESIVTVHYFEFAKNYVFEGERHDFWELVYVDKGELEIMAEDKGYKLKQGEMIFHKPNEFHNLWANGKIAPNIIVITFDCNSTAMEFFENKFLLTGNTVKDLLSKIIKEVIQAFSTPLNVSITSKLDRRESSVFGTEQLIKIYLEQVLIYLVRRGENIVPNERLSSLVRIRSHNDLTKKIINYLKDNIASNISFDDVYLYSKFGSTNLKSMFKEQIGIGVIEYYKNLKVDEAKKSFGKNNLILPKLIYLWKSLLLHQIIHLYQEIAGV